MKKRAVIVAVLLSLCLAGCGDKAAENVSGEQVISTESEDASAENEESSIESSETESTEPEEEEPTYTERKDVYVLEQEFLVIPDEEKIDMEALPIFDGEHETVLVKELDVYYENRQCAGYAKEGATPYLLSADDEWCLMIFEAGNFLVKRNELFDSMMFASEYNKQNQMVENTEAEEKESTEILPTYTVTDMSKTMYAKQSVNVRTGPSSDYEKLGGLSTNQEVMVTGQADTGWYRISFNGNEAFVSDSYLSDTMVQVAVQPETTIPDGGTNGESVPLVPEPEIAPDTPSTTYSEAEVLAIYRSVLESGGLQWYPDSDLYALCPEFGLDGGMGWGITEVSMNDPYTAANSALEGALWSGYHYFYLESLGVSNGYVTIKAYSSP